MASARRVLLVPDFKHWILGAFAVAIAEANPDIIPTICSAQVLLALSGRLPEIIGNIDIVHFLTPWESRELLPVFRPRVACATSIHHVVHWPPLRHNADADALMVVSRQWQGRLGGLGVPRDLMVRVPVGVDVETFVPGTAEARAAIRTSLGFSPAHVVIGFSAKHSSDANRRKGVDVFVSGLIKLRNQLPHVGAVIIGPGWELVVKKLTAAGVDCVWRPFTLDHGEVARLFRGLDFYWVTSRIEGGPAPLVEAMASGVCCIATPVGLVEEAITHGKTGFIVPFEDVRGFVNITAELAAAPERRAAIAHEARLVAEKRFSWSVTARSAADLYDKALARFAERGGIRSVTGESARDDRDYLAAIPSELRQQVLAREELLWMDQLHREGQWQEAGRAWLAGFSHAPGRPEVWKALVRHARHGMTRTIRQAAVPRAA